MTLHELDNHTADLNDLLQDRLAEKASIGVKTNLFYKTGTFQPMAGGSTSGVTNHRGPSQRQLELDEEITQLKDALADLTEQRKRAVAEENERLVAEAKPAIVAELRKFAPALAQFFESLKIFEDTNTSCHCVTRNSDRCSLSISTLRATT